MSDINAQIVSVYKELLQTKQRLKQRRSDGKKLVPQLQLLARCFDPKEGDCDIAHIGKNHLSIWDGEYKQIETPLNIGKIALDILTLEEEEQSLQEQLDSLLEIT